jgi:hypothetical protein
MHAHLVLISAALWFGPAAAEKGATIFGPKNDYVKLAPTGEPTPAEAPTLAPSRNEKSPAANYVTTGNLVRLKHYKYEDCTGTELRARRSICATLDGALLEQCKQRVDEFTRFCTDDPYKVLVASVGAPVLARVKRYEADFDEYIEQNKLDTSALGHDSSVKAFVSPLDLFKCLEFQRACSIYRSKLNDLYKFNYDRKTMLDRLRLSPDAAHPNSRRGLAEAGEDCEIVKDVNCYEELEETIGKITPAHLERIGWHDRISLGHIVPHETISEINTYGYKDCTANDLRKRQNICATLAESTDFVLCHHFLDKFKSFCTNHPFEVLKASLPRGIFYSLRRYEAKLDDFIKEKGLSADGDERQATVLKFYRSLNHLEGPDFADTCLSFYDAFQETMEQFEQDQQTTLDRIRQHPDAYSSRSIAEAFEDCRIVVYSSG